MGGGYGWHSKAVMFALGIFGLLLHELRGDIIRFLGICGLA